jgi:hypothetical protein
MRGKSRYIAILASALATSCPLAKASLISGWGAESGFANGTVTDTTGTLGAGTFNTTAPTGNLAPRADLPSTLTLTNVGDQIVTSGTVQMLGTTGDNGNQSFRICLVDAPSTSDFGTLSGGVWTGSTPTGWLGYLVEIGNLAAASGTTIIDDHKSPNTSAWLSTSANANTLLSTAVPGPADAAPDTYNFNLTLTLASASSIGLSYSFTSLNGVSLSGSVTDTAPLTYSFNAVGFLENTSSGGAADYSNVQVNYIPVPEPASLGLLGLSSLGLLTRSRRKLA